MKKSQIPISKYQINPKSQNQSYKLCFGHWNFGYWKLFGICSIIVSLIFGFFLIGCEQVDKETLAKIAQDDPSFKEQLSRKEELDSRINLLLNQLQDAKTAAYSNIRTIQENFNKQKTEMDSKITALKKELDPERFKIRQEIETFTNAISSKKGVLKNLESTKRNLLSLINQQKAVKATTEEMAKWQERLAALNKEIEPFKGEVRELEDKLHLLRLKLISLRQ